MNKKTPRTRVLSRACFMAMLVFALPALSSPVAWKPELSLPTSGSFGPSDTIRIILPKLPNETRQRLSLELDDMDITRMVSYEGNRALFTPPQPMTWGIHHLRLVEHSPEGDIIERGVWTLEVRKNPRFREADLNGNMTLNLIRRVADDDLIGAVQRNQANGAAQLRGAVADGDWRISGNADVLYNNQEIQMPRAKNPVDVGPFLLTGSAGMFSVNAGHHAVAPDSLVMQGFTRRGISASIASPETGASLTGFGLRAQDITGTQEGFGIGDANNRINGVTAMVRPIAADQDALMLAATYLSGEGPDQIGTGVGGDPTVTGGRAGSLVADGNLFKKRMRLRGEYATTEYDFDGRHVGNAAQSDRAYAAMAVFTPWHQAVVKDQPLTASLGVENKRIGTFFRSPAFPGGVTDRKILRGFASIDWFGLNTQISLGHETDNVDDLVLLPRTETTQGIVSLTYAPIQRPAPDGQLPPTSWYGQPIYNITHVDLDQGVEKATATLASGALHATRNTTLSAMFHYGTWNWSVSHVTGRDEDFSNVAADTKNRMTQFNADVRVGEKLSVSPSVQFNEISNGNNNALDSETMTTGMNVGYAFSQRVNGGLGYYANRQQVKDGSTNLRSHDITGNLNWTVQPAAGVKPGVVLSLEGQYHDNEDRVTTANNQNNYQVFMKLAVSWQAGY